MKYYYLSTDERNRIPYAVNKNRAVDIRSITVEELENLSRWLTVEMIFPMEGFFPDIICRPCLFLSEIFIEVFEMYDVKCTYKGAKLLDKEKEICRTYYLTAIEELDCMSFETVFNKTGNQVKKLIMDRQEVGEKVAFRIKGYKEPGFVGRLDYVESILRRGVRGIRMEEISIT